jgi:hypothetical protein
MEDPNVMKLTPRLGLEVYPNGDGATTISVHPDDVPALIALLTRQCEIARQGT